MVVDLGGKTGSTIFFLPSGENTDFQYFPLQMIYGFHYLWFLQCRILFFLVAVYAQLLRKLTKSSFIILFCVSEDIV